MAAHVEGHAEQSIADVCFTAATGRAHLAHRLAVSASTREELVELLRRAGEGDPKAGVRGELRSTNPAKAAWLFTGQGSQYAGVARQLYGTAPTFRATIDRCDALLRPHVDQSLLSVLYPADDAASPIDETGWTQPALFSVEYALAMLWREWGVEPAAVLGHSVGEYVAAAVAGVFGLEDAIRLIAARGRLMQALPAGGAMAAVFAPEAQVVEAIRPYADRVSLAAVNGPRELVISGDGAAVQQIRDALGAAGVKSKPLVVSHAFHSPLMDPMLDEFERIARAVTCRPPRVPLVSNVTGAFVAADAPMDASYWRRHIRQPVRFFDSATAVRDKGITTFLEIGPAPILSGLVKQGLSGGDVRVIASLRKGRDEWTTLLDALGGLYVAGVPIDWRGVDGPYARRRLVLPTSPFQRRRYWVERDASREPVAAAATRADAAVHPLLGRQIDLADAGGRRVWENTLSLDRLAFLLDHQVQNVPVLPATAYLEMAIAAMSEVSGEGPVGISSITYHRPMFLQRDRERALQFILAPAADGGHAFEVFSRDAGRPGWTRHATGTVVRLAPPADPARGFAEMAAARARCGETVAGPDFYASLAARGNTWGPAFQGLTRVSRRDGEAVSEVRVHESLRADLPRYFVHPAVADTSGHVLTATIPLAASSGARGGAFVGGAIDEVRFYARATTDTLHAYARLRDDAPAGGNILVGDVRVYDDAGQLLSETLGARLFYFDGVEPPAAPPNVADWLYETAWRAAPRTGPATPARLLDGPGAWLVFCDRDGVGPALASVLRARGERVYRVHPAAELRMADDDLIELPSDAPHEARRLVAQLSARGERLRGAVHLWSLDQPSAAAASTREIDETCAAPCASALNLVNALARNAFGEPPRVWLVTRGAQPVAPGDPGEAAQAALWGFGRALSAERAALWGGLIDLDSRATPAASAARICDELLGPDAEDQNRLPRR